MMYETVNVRFTRSYQAYRTGQVVPVGIGLARTLELMGRAEVVKEAQIEFATAPEPVGIEVAVAPPMKAKRGRPRKKP